MPTTFPDAKEQEEKHAEEKQFINRPLHILWTHYHSGFVRRCWQDVQINIFLVTFSFLFSALGSNILYKPGFSVWVLNETLSTQMLCILKGVCRRAGVLTPFENRQAVCPAASCRHTHNFPYNVYVHPSAIWLEVKCCHVHLVHVAFTIQTTLFKDFRGFIQSSQKIRGKL
jgi:hypothetical protein